MFNITDFIIVFTTLFIIMDPFAATPIFISLTKKFNQKKRIKTANYAILIAGALLLIFLFFGTLILKFFSISLDSFRVAGGIILLVFGIKYVLNIQWEKEHMKDYDVASVPIGTPLITGPGVITTIIILVGKYGYFIPLLASVSCLFIFWIFLRFSDRIHKFIGDNGAEILSRIMGLIIAAFAVEFIKTGIIGLINTV
jgi:multiple antibiotic resistance protein